MTAGIKNSGFVKWILIIVVFFYFINISAALDVNLIQWETGISGTLKRNEILTFNGYSVKVVNFNAPVESDKYKQIPNEPVEPFVGLNISKDDVLLNFTVIGQGGSYISADGEFKVTAVEMPGSLSGDWLYESYSPWVKLELSKRGKPNLDIAMEADDEYISLSNTEIVVDVKLTNTGTADLLNVDMDIGTAIPLLRGKLKYHYDAIRKGAQISETVTFSSPIITELIQYDIHVNSSGVDIKGDIYKSTIFKTIFIAPPPLQAPSLTKSTNPKAYLKDLIMVSIDFKNNANYELKNVSIVDSIPEGFRQLSNNSLRWKVNVPPNGEWYFRYLLKPMEANSNGVILPPTVAEYELKKELYRIESNRPETIIYGPRIDLTKQSDVSEINPGDAVTITVVAVNSGSTPSMVTIKDTLPDDTKIISGSTIHNDYLEAGKDVSFSYTISTNSNGTIILPPATAEYFELGSKGTKINTTSKELIISPKPPPTPEPTPEPTVEIPVDITEDVNISEPVEPPVETPEPALTLIEEPVSKPLSVNSEAVLDILIGCKNINDMPLNLNMTFEVCSYITNDQ